MIISSVLKVVCISHEGDIDALLVECHTIQQHLQHSHHTPTDSSHIFARLVSRERLKLPCGFSQNSHMAQFFLLSTPVEESAVFDELIKKHPNPSPATPISLINPDITTLQSCHPVSSLIVWMVVVLLFALRYLLSFRG